MQPQTQTAGPGPRRWTKAEYYRMAELGWFRGQRVELIEGDVMVLSPQGWPHALTTDQVRDVLDQHLRRNFWVRMQLPLDLGDPSEPEPDVSVVAGKRTDYSAHPTTAALVVEVSDTSLWYDRGRKASLYGRAGIGDYWIVNLVDRQLEVCRKPVPDPAQPFGFRYSSARTLTLADHVSPRDAPRVRIAVADLFP